MARKTTRTPPTPGPSASTTPDTDAQRRASLASLLSTILRELNTLTPTDTVLVPIPLALDLAQLLQEHIASIQPYHPGATHDLLSTGVHNYYLAHGFYHACLEADSPQPHLAQQIARVILQHADPLTKLRFLRNHPEAATPAAQQHKEPRA